MNWIVAFAPAYPPDSGDPRSAAPLETETTTLPGSNGSSNASRSQWNACRTSTSQFRLNVSQVCLSSGRLNGLAPALSTSVRGRYRSISDPATKGSVTSPTTGVNPLPTCSATASSRARSRATPTTCAPAAANAVAIAFPNPRLAPVTTAVVPEISDISRLPRSRAVAHRGRHRTPPKLIGVASVRMEPTEIPPWRWPDDDWRRAVNHVRAGRPLRAPWPDGTRVAVALSFDSDHETLSLRNGETSPGELSRGEY